LEAHLRVWKQFYVGVTGRIPLTSATLLNPEGDIELSPWLVGGLVGANLGERRSIVHGDVSLGFLMLLARLKATALAPFLGSEQSRWLPVPIIHSSLVLAATPWLQLMIEGTLGVSWRTVILNVAGREAATIGPLVATVGAGVSLALP
jgi:hypothetical protein